MAVASAAAIIWGLASGAAAVPTHPYGDSTLLLHTTAWWLSVVAVIALATLVAGAGAIRGIAYARTGANGAATAG